MSPPLLLAVYCVLILLASLAGGWIPLLVRLTHTRLQVATSFVAGLMLGVGLLHLLPHAWHQARSIDVVAKWLVIGFLAMFFIQRFFHFHHHDVPDDSGEEPQATTVIHDCTRHNHGDHGSGHSLAEQSARRLSWAGAALGLLLHTLMDGVALAASVQADSHRESHGLPIGFGTFLVVFLHKPFDSMAIGTLMAREKRPASSIHVVNGLFAIAMPVGVLLFFLVADLYTGTSSQFWGAALAFSAGSFLCISTSDLLPELQFHSHDRLKLSLALLLGLAVSALIGRFESSGHDQHLPAASYSLSLSALE